MIYFSVKKNNVLIKPDISGNQDEHFAWCVARVVEELNYSDKESKRAENAFSSFVSDMQKNKFTQKMLYANNRLDKFIDDLRQGNKEMTASRVSLLFASPKIMGMIAI